MRFCAQAESARDKAPMLICEKLNVHVENLKVSGTIYFIHEHNISLDLKI